jgi:hypothetical protein
MILVTGAVDEASRMSRARRGRGLWPSVIATADGARGDHLTMVLLAS